MPDRIPEGWRECKLGEVAEIKGGKRLPKKVNLINTPNSHPYIRTRDINNHKIMINELLFVPENVFPLISWYTVDTNDIIISIAGTIGLCAIIPPLLDHANLTENCAKLINLKEEKIDRKYLFYYLISSIGNEEIKVRIVGSTQPKLPLYNIRDIPILLPSLPEQRAIASLLSSFDDKIDLLYRENQTLEQMAEVIFRQWFIEEADEEWEEGTIEDVIEFNPPRKLMKGTVAPYLEMASLSNSTFMPDNWYEREYFSGTRFINGDTLLARITPCLENGKTAFVTFLKEKEVAWGSTEYIVMRPKEQINPFFAYILARLKDFRDYAKGCLEGSSGRQRVNINHLMAYPIKIPNKEAILNFNSIVDKIVPKLQNNASQIRTLEKLRDTLLPKLMSGEVRVKV
jgi:type I restriction enzyme S subunit